MTQDWLTPLREASKNNKNSKCQMGSLAPPLSSTIHTCLWADSLPCTWVFFFFSLEPLKGAALLSSRCPGLNQCASWSFSEKSCCLGRRWLDVAFSGFCGILGRTSGTDGFSHSGRQCGKCKSSAGVDRQLNLNQLQLSEEDLLTKQVSLAVKWNRNVNRYVHPCEWRLFEMPAKSQ